MFVIKYHAQNKGSWCYKTKHGADQPKPGPIFFLTRIFANRYGPEDFWAEICKEVSDGIVAARPPNIRRIFIVNAEKIISPQGYKAQFALENLV